MKNVKFLTAILVFVAFNMVAMGQSDEDQKDLPWYKKGSINGKVFANFNTSGSDIGTSNAFEVTRAYLGYSINLDDNWSSNIKLDIGKPSDFKSGDLEVGRRFTFIKNANLQYKYDKLKVQFGIADAFQFKVQEKFWGYRYIQASFQDKNKFGSSADIGLFASYKFTDWLNADYSINNGDGYGKIQADDILKNTLGLTLTPVKALTLRVYGDKSSMSDSSQTSMALFAGVKVKDFSLGGEYNYQWNNKFKIGNDFSGLSFYATYKFLEKYKVFARFDHLESAIVDASVSPDAWNLKKDGDFIIGGLEYAPMKNINLALNYQHYAAASSSDNNVSTIYFNVQVAF